MNTNVPTLGQISGDDWKSDSGALRDGLDQVSANIANAFLVEHTSDNTHGTIHASGTISERGRTTPMGEWINVPFTSIVLAIPGVGNSWIIAAQPPGVQFYQLSYVLIGKTMWLNIALPVTALTVAAATGIVTVAMPPGYRVAGVSSAGSFVGRSYFGYAIVLNSGTQVPGVIFANAGAKAVTIQQASGANYVTDASFTVEGQIMLEVETI